MRFETAGPILLTGHCQVASSGHVIGKTSGSGLTARIIDPLQRLSIGDSVGAAHDYVQRIFVKRSGRMALTPHFSAVDRP
jgi:hypothetical protein